MDFPTVFKHVVGLEGGYVNDPKDPGGETNFGISKRAHPKINIKNLTLREAKAIYFDDYWCAAQCVQVKPKWARLLVFDCAVNQGVGVARELWKRARWDPYVFMALRAQRYAQTKNYDRYGKGWFKRLFRVMGESAKVESNGNCKSEC